MTISSIKENSSRFLSAAKGYTRVLWERSAGIQVNVTGTALEKLGNAEDVLLHMPMIRKKGDETDVFDKGAPTIYINGIEMRSGGCLQNRLKNKIKYENVNMRSAARPSTTTKPTSSSRPCRRSSFRTVSSDAGGNGRTRR